MDRRFFVLTATGERGPFTVDDLKSELKAGAVQRSDHLRTALGKSAGTVGELVGPLAGARTSGRMAAAGPAAENQPAGGPKVASNTGMPNAKQAPRQSAKSSRQSSSTNERPVLPIGRQRGAAKTGIDWRLPAAILVALVLLAGAVFALKGTSSAAVVGEEKSAAAATKAEPIAPLVRVDVVQKIALPGKPGLIRITCDRVLTTALTLRGNTSGFQAPSLVIAAGTAVLDIPVAIPDRKSGTKEKLNTEAIVTLQPDNSYRLGTGIHAVVRLRGNPDPVIASDDFVGHATGWSEGWAGNPLEAVTGFGAKVTSKSSLRALKTRISSGDVWISYVMRADANLSDTSGLSFFDQGHEWIFVGRASSRSGLSIEYSPETSKFLCLPDHQFTTPTRVVIHLRLATNQTTISWWIPTIAEIDAPAPLGSLVVPAIAFDTIRVLAMQPWSIGDLRMGQSWEEVVPLP